MKRISSFFVVLVLILVACEDREVQQASSVHTTNANMLNSNFAIAERNSDGMYQSLKDLTQLSDYFSSDFNRIFDQDVRLEQADGVLSLMSTVRDEPTQQLASLEFIEVRDVPVVDDEGNRTGETRPYLALKGNRADGNCITSLIPLVQENDFFYVKEDLLDGGFTTRQIPAQPSPQTCDYSHSCEGSDCWSCELEVSENGCRGYCECGSIFGKCNHTVSTR